MTTAAGLRAPGLSRQALHWRIRNGWPLGRAVTHPVRAWRRASAHDVLERTTTMKTPSRPQLVRQGDVLLIPTTDPVPGERAPKDRRGLVLAEGESSHHFHRVFGRAKLYQRAGTERMLVVERAGAELRVVGGGGGGVERHAPISLAPGSYLVRVQQSWDSSRAQSRQVAD